MVTKFFFPQWLARRLMDKVDNKLDFCTSFYNLCQKQNKSYSTLKSSLKYLKQTHILETNTMIELWD